MEIDVARHIGAVSREVRSVARDGRELKAVVAQRSYDTSVADLWDAISNPERIPRWFLPITGELRQGGRYQFEGNAGGEIRECEPPRRLAVTWEFGGGVSWLEVRLAEQPGGGVLLELEHVMAADAHWEQFGPGAAGVGWELGLMGLAEHLTGGSADPAQGLAWMASAEGREFMRRSSAGWGEADVVGGAEAAQAQASAGRTAAFYTGEGPAAAAAPAAD
jgi:uncharacterized protein YndB with AHSA1/START domain